jgi:hypothetical protein
MKIELTKHNMTRWCQQEELDLLVSAGWRKKEQPQEDVIRPKAPVKSKATVTAVEEANINIQGDE